MGHWQRKTRDLFTLLRMGHRGIAVNAVRRRLYSDDLVSYGVRRDLGSPFAVPPAKVPLTLRRLQPDDDLSVLSISADSAPRTAYDNLSQRRMLDSGIPFWVGSDPEGEPAFLQAMLTEEDNETVRAYFGDLFPWIGPDEALLEGAFTAPRYRSGHGVGAHVTVRLAEKAKEMNKRWLITFVQADNIAALKLARKTGFLPYSVRRESWRMMKRRVRFTPLPQGTPYPLEQQGPTT
jgi:hypothetical protein